MAWAVGSASPRGPRPCDNNRLSDRYRDGSFRAHEAARQRAGRYLSQWPDWNDTHPGVTAETFSGLDAALHQQLLYLADGTGRVQSLGAGLRAIHDRVTPIKPERI